jgi:predicted O-methyltransferase YrrM
MAGRQALEVGCFLGWSACHMALAGVNLDIVDPILANEDFRVSVVESLTAAGAIQQCRLIAAPSPVAVSELAEKHSRIWSLIFIDGDHEGDAPLRDAIECAKHAAMDCVVVFHDLYSPHVAEGLRYFKAIGWNIRIYMTTQIMGIAWRGAVTPIEHIPDPRIASSWPGHLNDLVEASR